MAQLKKQDEEQHAKTTEHKTASVVCKEMEDRTKQKQTLAYIGPKQAHSIKRIQSALERDFKEQASFLDTEIGEPSAEEVNNEAKLVPGEGRDGPESVVSAVVADSPHPATDDPTLVSETGSAAPRKTMQAMLDEALEKKFYKQAFRITAMMVGITKPHPALESFKNACEAYEEKLTATKEGLSASTKARSETVNVNESTAAVEGTRMQYSDEVYKDVQHLTSPSQPVTSPARYPSNEGSNAILSDVRPIVDELTGLQFTESEPDETPACTSGQKSSLVFGGIAVGQPVDLPERSAPPLGTRHPASKPSLADMEDFYGKRSASPEPAMGSDLASTRNTYQFDDAPHIEEKVKSHMDAAKAGAMRSTTVPT